MNYNNTATTNKEPKLLVSKLSKCGFLLIFAMFVVIVTFCISISMTIPNPWFSKTLSTWDCDEKVSNFDKKICHGIDLNEQKTKLTVAFGPFTVLNQETRISLIPQKRFGREGISAKGITEISYKLYGSALPIDKNSKVDTNSLELLEEKTITRKVKCPASRGLDCKAIPLASQIYLTHPNYLLEFTFTPTDISLGDIIVENSYISTSYSVFEMFWRMAFILFSSFCCMLYLSSIRGIPISQWCHEQKWTFILNIVLILFNNPFFFYEYIVDSVTFLLFNTGIETFFICFLMFYVLSMFEALRKPLNIRKSFRFILPRALLLLTLFMLVFTELMYNRTTPNYSITLKGIDDPANVVLSILILGIIVIYIFWLVFGIIRTYSESRKLGPVSLRLKYYGGFTICVIILYLCLLIAANFMGYHNNASITLTTLAYVNLYVMTLTILYLPVEMNNVPGNRVNLQNNVIHLDEEIKSGDDDLIVVDDEKGNDLIVIDE
ncbi:hypothetical protein EHI8A_049280 [Entamoeba histolytica HM-1:IMSS-B]|uniref:Wntless-like transmembrane domain-containing protein n=5 Tax=Entamoeba histolytica TaxID=5759 RepID=C4M9X2_ENTH1|nr:hypothetical protein EHI_179320 [Entamoeba histolytica HM-1:IMSS]EMH75254.1 hypothetical protein EHI8A_049280 [Entamoeba histolytica HM-1:IMSS-B]EMS15791.1 G protein-coupled receptor 1, putative [Entamoeba histolytica HM-3:IMSS]ENY59951.1 G protein-coupled receptor 1, putative [Entamoeba histolytica HM-1:IMSS-A]GAT98532.1 hypothetical protein CL6EHI_179320 [Entamoeba histolytica]EAL45605.1 hypothetical protein EHI_179320 [Entamoeba histolytica HM-1:IMSS]|eukprot:XP_650991.1 hypothetical protein EHI_179320 [Entamoeba histolytica HM-1:IMSS]